MGVDAILAKVFGTKHEREVKALRPTIQAIGEMEPRMQEMSDEELAAQTVRFREQLAQGASLDDLLIPAFATVREAGRRVLNMRHFDVQLIGGITLHRGKVAEMKTGEGKTLVATLPCYLNALEGKGVHVVTVNDYLARRDSEWMGRIHKFLGLNVGVILHDLSDQERRDAYNCDITYGTNNEFGFDYLRDNMKFRLSDCVQRGHHYGIVDEVDSILIDEARTPLIISGPAELSTDLYYEVDRIIPRLSAGAGRCLAELAQRLKAQGQLLESYSYARTLDRGFALVLDDNRHPVTARAQTRSGQHVTLSFADGEAGAVIDGAAPTEKPRKPAPVNPKQDSLF